MTKQTFIIEDISKISPMELLGMLEDGGRIDAKITEIKPIKNLYKKLDAIPINPREKQIISMVKELLPNPLGLTEINLSKDGAEKLLQAITKSNLGYTESRELAKIVFDYAKIAKESRE